MRSKAEITDVRNHFARDNPDRGEVEKFASAAIVTVLDWALGGENEYVQVLADLWAKERRKNAELN